MEIFSKLKQNPLEFYSRKENIIIVLVSLILIFSPLFYKLNEEPLKRWDESLYAMVSYDLAYHGKALKAWEDFQGKENWTLPVTKPQTLFWMQAGFMKIFGYDSKIAIRLPSVLASMLLMIFIIWFFYKRFNSLLMGIFICFVLVTIKAYMFHHIARSGDFDAFLLLFSTMALLFYYEFLETGLDKNSYKYFYLTCASFAGAVLFKNVAGLFMLPGLFIYTLSRKKLLVLLKSKQLYFGIGIFILIITPYYLYEILTFPHYLKDLWSEEIGGRYTGIIDNNQRPFLFYFQQLFASGNHTPWILFLPLAIIIIWSLKQNELKSFLKFALIIIFTFIVLITFAQTKISHYIAPTYPFLAMVIGIAIFYIFSALLLYLKESNSILKLLLFASFGLAFIFPTYLDIFQRTTSYKTIGNDCGFFYDVYEECFKEIYTHKPEYKNLTVYRDSTDWWIPQLVFYKNVYNDLYHLNISITEDPAGLKNNQNVVVCYSHMDDIEDKYKYDVLLKFREIQVLKITGEANNLYESNKND